MNDLKTNASADVVLDLHDVGGANSFVLGVLISAGCRVKETGGNLVLWRPQGMVG